MNVNTVLSKKFSKTAASVMVWKNTRAIQKVTSGELLTKQAMRKNCII
jgi:hypothetical protein